jgi:hypothetical protein
MAVRLSSSAVRVGVSRLTARMLLICQSYRSGSKVSLRSVRDYNLQVFVNTQLILAVRVGFEPTEPVKVQRFSRPPDSTTLAPHRVCGLSTLYQHAVLSAFLKGLFPRRK